MAAHQTQLSPFAALWPVLCRFCICTVRRLSRLPVLVHTYAVLSGNQALAVNGTTSGLTWGWALEAPFSPPPQRQQKLHW